MSTESYLDFEKDSKLTLSYKNNKGDIRSITGYIKKFDGSNIVVHNESREISINFNLNTKNGKKLCKSNSEINKISVKTFRLWKYNNEIHIVLPNADDLQNNDSYPIVVNGGEENRYNIDFKDIEFNVNGHKIGVTSQKEGSEWIITDISIADYNDDQIIKSGFHNVISEYTVIYIATKLNIGVFSFNELDRSKFTH